MSEWHQILFIVTFISSIVGLFHRFMTSEDDSETRMGKNLNSLLLAGIVFGIIWAFVGLVYGLILMYDWLGNV